MPKARKADMAKQTHTILDEPRPQGNPEAPPVFLHGRQRYLQEKKEKGRMVRGVFYNTKEPNRVISFPLRLYPGPIERYTFKHGREETIPFYVAEHINKTVGQVKFKNELGPEGKLVEDGKEMRFGFSIMEFID